ncbi:hypothetical protein [Brevundimonas sp. GCM10030266]|uniref:hypothetical protein n=1 Tax=Brevundimonas sp. GCM10030266 TaxID=3273386 RepID=UPI0036084D11
MRKTHLWISLIVGVLVWGAYFVHFIQSLRGEATGGLVWWFLGALAITVIAETVATGLIGWLFRRRTRALDEGPTLQAALKASHVALMLLIAMILGAALLLSVSSLFGWTLISLSESTPVIAANILLAMVVIAELARAALTLALLPRR